MKSHRISRSGLPAANNELRKFGIIFGIALSIMGTINLFKGHTDVYPYFYSIGILVFIMGVFSQGTFTIKYCA